jgi:hypothetical protein
MKITYEIDSMDWGTNPDTLEDRDRCVEALGDWFEKLSTKTKLAIYYAQKYDMSVLVAADEFQPSSDGCPWLGMLYAAQNRVLKKIAPYADCYTGHNLFLYVTVRN